MKSQGPLRRASSPDRYDVLDQADGTGEPSSVLLLKFVA